jgi:hypothetical protein
MGSTQGEMGVAMAFNLKRITSVLGAINWPKRFNTPDKRFNETLNLNF